MSWNVTLVLRISGYLANKDQNVLKKNQAVLLSIVNISIIILVIAVVYGVPTIFPALC